eukprot:TRINITY_DN10378_c0_g1_i1.p1 TRINITY_DN10378_c0_g1~~TRINITY_DN10378_c0_g1_i1.p1  ORF type:complete len:346 (+),score=64.61 TRINITY_DN10378_c0_g1_i1:28-1065(+)
MTKTKLKKNYGMNKLGIKRTLRGKLAFLDTNGDYQIAMLFWIFLIVFLYLCLRTLALRFSSNRINLRGNAYLITGGTSGIGRSLAEKLASRGAFVYVGDINEPSRSEEHVRFIKMDVTNQSSVDAAFKIIEQDGRNLDGVINCAGILTHRYLDPSKPQSVGEMNVDRQIRPFMEINVMGTMRVNSTMLPLLLRSKGCIINMASTMGIVAMPMNGPYCTSKHALVGYSACLRRELAGCGIRVICIQPGAVNTPMTTHVFQVENFDFSTSRLPNIRHLMRNQTHENRTKFGKRFQTAEMVSEATIGAMLSTPFYEPHVIVDNAIESTFWRAMSVLPWEIVDAIFKLI